eukprot:CAMPEP_0172360216 /NCGR_PEP_ID=MMETSP1060-20121228/4294_1 /TAXON_ID=37318 /ORGANISM="Pseudo-nitzschia pungens, Strain cf. cingulata" /LENGTH=891 /DNA_ID=CAMNT_0013082157 /DNA_START=203 /DNA_END=2878 /DNA_ORIENTATION=+
MTQLLGSNPTGMSNGGSGGFGNLASASLPSLGGDPLTRPTWKRSLQELAASNLAVMGNGSGGSGGSGGGAAAAAVAPPTAAAQMLLGSRTDFGSLLANKKSRPGPQQRQAPQSSPFLSSSSSSSSSASLPGGRVSLEAMRRYRDGMLERILRDKGEQMQQLLGKAVERQIEDDWNEERKWWGEELVGDRNLVDATNDHGNSALAAAAVSRKAGGGRASTAGIHPLGGGAGGAGASAGAGANASRLLIADYRSGGTASGGCDPAAMKEHLDVVREIQPTSDPLWAAERFEQLACTEALFGGGYKNAWMLLRCMLPSLQTPIKGAEGALAFVCKQYQTLIYGHVKSASLSGQDVSALPHTYGAEGSTAETIAAYVKLISGSHASVWEILYYCLRCGDAEAAKDVLHATPAGREQFMEQPFLSDVIGKQSARQGAASCIFENGSPMISSEHRSIILNMHEKTKNLEPDNTHKLSVLALLCGGQLESYPSIEDYLFGRLWFALMDREDPVSRIKEIGASVRKYGPSYFTGDGCGEWNYVLPLMVSQQFETALSYLGQAGGPTGLLQATHLGIVFALARVNVADLGDASSSSRGSSPRDVVTTLLVNYAILSEREPSARVLASLEYLLMIPNTEESNHQVANLIHRSPTDQREGLIGVLDAVGNRKESELDRRLPEHEVCAILDEAAELFKKQVSDRSKAELSAQLFMLGYKHSKLVQLLNEQLSPITLFDEDKRYWTAQSELFYDAYLSKRTKVLDSIEREGKLGLIETNRSLLQLRSFMDAYNQRQFEAAFGIVSRTGLLPFSQDDLNEKSSKFVDLDPILKKEIPSVLTATVECVCELFHRLKSESRGLPAVVVDRLKELQYLARYLFIYAGFVHMPSSCKNDIARMRAHMIL